MSTNVVIIDAHCEKCRSTGVVIDHRSRPGTPHHVCPQCEGRGGVKIQIVYKPFTKRGKRPAGDVTSVISRCYDNRLQPESGPCNIPYKSFLQGDMPEEHPTLTAHISTSDEFNPCTSRTLLITQHKE